MIAEGVGISATFSYKGNYQIENGNMYVSTSLITRFGNDIHPCGEVLIYVNGTQMEQKNMTIPSSMIYESGTIPVGLANFNLNRYSGYVEVKIHFGYDYTNSGTGITSAATTKTIYAAYR